MTPKRSPKELRRFGLTVGIAFAVLGGVSYWRGHHLPPRILWTLSFLLVTPALIAPSILGPVERGWLKMAHVLGEVNTRIILGAVFYLVVMPIGLVRRFFKDPLDRDFPSQRASYWIKREPEKIDPARYEQQF